MKMELSEIPKLIASSVVRGSEKGQSHGGIYTIDFARQSVDQHIDWNKGDIDFSGRGWDRGLRGIEFSETEVFIAASDELFCYNPQFELIASYTNPYLRHCHEVSRRDNTLFLSSTGYDSLLAFDLVSRTFIWGVYLSRNGREWVAQAFDPRAEGGPPLSNNYHINMVHVVSSGIFCSGLHTKALLQLNAEMQVSEVCNLPAGTHNAQPFNGGVLFNDTNSDVVRYVSRDGTQRALSIPRYDIEDIEFTGVDDSRIARQAFGRGLCAINERYIAAGSSPSTVSLYDLQVGERIAAVNLSMDIRNAIHGLEVWPFSG
ncbi:MAG: hypothetical protein ACR2P1_21415 [Pseudomonadales bacterium]